MPFARRTRKVLGFSSALVMMAGCAAVETEPPVDTPAYVKYDPLSGALPLPTDLVLDKATGRLALPTNGPDIHPSDLAIRKYFNTLEGFPGYVAATADFVEERFPLRPATLAPESLNPDTVPIFDITEGLDKAQPVVVRRRLTKGGSGLEIAMDGGYPAKHTYLAAIIGGARGVRTVSGGMVGADFVFALLRGTEPLDQHPDAFASLPRDERQPLAAFAESVRLDLQPFFEFFESRGLARGDIAALWSWTTDRQRPLLVYDPTTGTLPFPNNAANDERGRIQIPALDSDTDLIRGIKAKLSGTVGFSMSGPALLFTNEPVDPASISDSTAHLYEVTPGGLERVPFVERTSGIGGTSVVMDPVDASLPPNGRVPLKPNTRYFFVGTTGLQTQSGQPFESPLVNEVMKLRTPVFENGRSVLSQLTDGDAAMVERARSALAGPLDQLEAEGLPREQIGSVADFTTFEPHGLLRHLARLPAARHVPPDVEVVRSEPPSLFSGAVVPMLNTSKLVTVRLSTYDRIDPVTRETLPGDAGAIRDIEVLACVPVAAAMDPERIPVVVFGHGFNMAKEAVVQVCDDFAAKGIAMVAMDFPYHGTRSLCINNEHCGQFDTCDVASGACKDASGNERPLAQLAPEQLIWAGVKPQPKATGAAFVDTRSVFATRDHIFQSVVDVAAVFSSLRRGDWSAVFEGRSVDVGAISYFGHSLGGIVGPLFLAGEPRVRAAVLNAAGGDYLRLFQDSPLLGPIFRQQLRDMGVDPDSPQFTFIEAAARWIFDPADPMIAAPYASGVRADFAYEGDDGESARASARPVLVQLATNDRIIPNTATVVMARELDAQVTEYSPAERPTVGGHVFVIDPSEPEGRRARTEAVEFLGEN